MNCVPGFFLLPTIVQFLMAFILGWFILLLGAPSRFFHVDTNQPGTEMSTLAKVLLHPGRQVPFIIESN